MPKIAILTIRNSYKYGGVLTCVRYLYKFCQKYFEPTVFYISFDPKNSTSIKRLKFSSGIRKTTYFGMNSVEVGARWAFWEPGHYVYNLKFWQKVLKDYDYFLMKSGSCIAAYPLVQLNKKFAMWVGTSYEDDRQQRIKNLSFIRSIIDWFSLSQMKRIEKKILQNADFIWSISSNTKKRIEQIIDKKRDNLIVSGFTMDSSTRLDNKELAKNKNIIVVGRFSDPRKNFPMLIKTFKKIFVNMPSSKLYIIGNKPENDELENYKDFDFFKNIVFTGKLDKEKLDYFYKKSDLMLITSYQEGLGIIGLEAMSYGIPVISTDCGGVVDYVVNDVTGYLVKINDDTDMANKALKVLNDEELYKKLSSNTLTFIDQNFSAKKIDNIFKYGLIKVYPELEGYFKKNDEILKQVQDDKKLTSCHPELVSRSHTNSKAMS